MKKLNSGFTLIELMIVVVIVGILAAIAYPSYARYVEKARRADAKSALLDASQRLERCYTQTNSYDHEDCPDLPVLSPDGHYLVDATDLTATTFALEADPNGTGTTGQQSNSPCGTFTFDSVGNRGDNGSTADRCWQ
jgi:type IV pilus assembly protein PilE